MTSAASPRRPYRVILATIALEPNRWTGRRNPRYTLQELMPLARQTGFDKLEVWQWHISHPYLEEAREIRQQADRLGLSFPYIGVYPRFHLHGPEAREEARLQDDILDKAEILGTPTLKVMLAAGLKGSNATAEQLSLVAERFGAWYQNARSRGIGMVAELHAGTLFDPPDVGIAFLNRFPDFDVGICFQPFDFTDLDGALALAERFKGQIRHIHLQAPQKESKGYVRLAESPLDYRRLLSPILRDNPGATMTLEFVKGCVQEDGPFTLAHVLTNAQRDAEFVESLLASSSS